ncbi:MAG: hypothetical protein JWR80_3168 [Bradyrhizobium sp.]|nr:hypothetical protein [Bradyrhizobium sp.]
MTATDGRPAEGLLRHVFAPSRIFLKLYAVSLTIDLLVGLIFRFRASPWALEADEREYYEIARNMLSGTVALTPRRSLGFPLLESALQYVTGNFVVLQCAIAAIYALSVPLLFVLARRLTEDVRVATASAVALMLWPPALYYGVSLYSEAVALPLLLLTLVVLPIGSRLATVQVRAGLPAFASGICLALTTHVRPMYLLFLPVILLIILLEERRIDVAIKRFALVVAGFGLLIAPWSIYMSMRYHHVIIVTSNGGETLAGGLSPQLLKMTGNQQIRLRDRTSWVGPGKWLTLEGNGYLSKAEQALPYDQMDGLLKARTLQWAESHPADAAYLEFSKLRYLWGFSSFADNDVNQTIFGAIPTIILLCASIACWLMIPQLRWRYPRLWLLPLFVSGVALISWGSWRFRQAGDAGLLAFCVIGIFLLLDRRRGGGPGRVPAISVPAE